MPPDKALVDETRNWLSKAETDLRSAGILFENDRSLDGIVLFHCQQAVEKALKGFLAYHNLAFRKTHHIGELAQQCIRFEPSLETLLRQASGLTVFAWAFRYPGDPEEPASEDAGAALALARDVYNAVLSALPEDVKP